MTEAEARAALAALDGVGGLERWLAEQHWLVVPGGWAVPEHFQGLRCRVEPAPGGVNVFGSDGWDESAVWFLPATRTG